jgi:hypothetical protein
LAEIQVRDVDARGRDLELAQCTEFSRKFDEQRENILGDTLRTHEEVANRDTF